MLAERYLRKRFEEGRKVERERTLKYVQKVQAWAQERVEAAEKGEPFDKPMPEYDDEDDE